MSEASALREDAVSKSLRENAVSKRQAAWELALFGLAGGAFVLSTLLEVPRRWAIGVLAATLVFYALLLKHRGRERPSDFGIRRDNLKASLREVGLFTGLAALSIAIYAWAFHVPFLRPEMLVLLPLYPLYGIAQQVAVQGVLHRRILRLSERPTLSMVLTAVGFGLLHTGTPALLVLTTCAGLGWSWLYQRHPNTLTLGLSHGVLAALAYPLVLDTNPLLNV